MKSRFLVTIVLGILFFIHSSASFSQRQAPHNDTQKWRELVPVPGSEFADPTDDPMWRAWMRIRAGGDSRVSECLNCSEGISTPFGPSVDAFRIAGFDQETSALLLTHILKSIDTAQSISAAVWPEICRNPEEIESYADIVKLREAATERRNAFLHGAFQEFWALVDEEGQRRLAGIPNQVLANSEPFDPPALSPAGYPPAQEVISRECYRIGRPNEARGPASMSLDEIARRIAEQEARGELPPK